MNIDIFSVNLCALKCIRPILLCSVYVDFFPLFSSLMIGPQLCFSPTLIQCSFISIQKRTELTNFNDHGIRWKKTRLKPEWGHPIGGKGTQNKKNSQRPLHSPFLGIPQNPQAKQPQHNCNEPSKNSCSCHYCWFNLCETLLTLLSWFYVMCFLGIQNTLFPKIFSRFFFYFRGVPWAPPNKFCCESLNLLQSDGGRSLSDENWSRHLFMNIGE